MSENIYRDATFITDKLTDSSDEEKKQEIYDGKINDTKINEELL